MGAIASFACASARGALNLLTRRLIRASKRIKGNHSTTGREHCRLGRDRHSSLQLQHSQGPQLHEHDLRMSAIGHIHQIFAQKKLDRADLPVVESASRIEMGFGCAE